MRDPTGPGQTRHDVAALAADAVVVGPGASILITLRDDVSDAAVARFVDVVCGKMPDVEVLTTPDVRALVLRTSPPPKCAAHGIPRCTACSRNPGNCGNESGDVGCATYGDTGMHWDTCPNRVEDTAPPCDCRPTVSAGPDVAAVRRLDEAWPEI